MCVCAFAGTCPVKRHGRRSPRQPSPQPDCSRAACQGMLRVRGKNRAENFLHESGPRPKPPAQIEKMQNLPRTCQGMLNALDKLKETGCERDRLK